MRLAYVSNVRIPLAKLLNSIEKTYDKKNYFLPDSRKNTAFTGNTGQFSTDASSGGLVRNAHRSPADTPGVTSDSAKVRKNTKSAKKIKNINGDEIITLSALTACRQRSALCQIVSVLSFCQLYFAKSPRMEQ